MDAPAMKVWMSRSRPGADRQAEDLRRAGYEVLVAPVIRIEALDPPPPDEACDWIVFLSEQAVAHGLPAVQRLPWFSGAGVLAVGERTAAVLAARGVQAQVPEEPTSEGLLALPALRTLTGRRVLVVAGEGGRSLLTEELTSRGADVRRLACYRRVSVRDLEQNVLGCEAVIAASAEGLAGVASLWLQAGGRADVPVLVPSARVARSGVELGLSNLHDCGGADSEAWLRGLAQL